MKHIEFDDAIKLSKLYPKSFQIPSREDLLKLEIGHNVKVCANDERFWTKIVEINFETEELIATVYNKLVKNNIKLNEKVKFHFKNIYSIYHLHC